ncbi:uncharacterized protein K02A2.6-like [Eupeodes corollae]|uniref:uncharacterized protein K02A2.6-like n=1 Tax=Eupeodes corollae TaxID=290404 RepID=UPI002491B825|nr:uncharacterized protein K02A2.6-like [Eupeodes corollae]
MPNGDTSKTEQNMTIFQASQMTEFSPETDSFTEWKERLEIHFTDIDVTLESSKKATLLKSIGTHAYSLLRALCDPKRPSDKKYDELCTLLEEHFMPPVMIYRERLNFYTASKNSDESVNSWYARVKTLALKCKFANLDEAVRDRFIMGMANNEKLFEKFCEEDEKLTIATALKKALIHEVKLKGNSMSTDVNFVRGNNSSGTQRNRRSNGHHQKRDACKHCGWRTHKSQTCKFRDATCDKCGKKGHLKPICRSKEKNLSTNFVNLNHTISHVQETNPNISTFVNTGTQVGPTCGDGTDWYSIFNISGSRKSNTFDLTVYINGIQFDVECDTGSPISLMPLTQYRKHFDTRCLKQNTEKYDDYGGHGIEIIGEFLPNIKYRDQTEEVEMVVTNVNRPILLGRKVFNFELRQVNAISSSSSTVSNQKNSVNPVPIQNFASNLDNTNVYNTIVQKLKTTFSEVFEEGLGKFTTAKVHLEVMPGTKPIFWKPRALPFAWKPIVEQKLNEFCDSGMMEPVDNADWGTPIVPVMKPNGDLRICGDFSVTLNKFLVDFKYPLPRIEEIFASLQGGQLFSKLDLSNAYNQLELDHESQNLCTLSTHLGLFRVKRLAFGIKPAGAIFQKTIETLLRGIPNCINFMDDIVVTGPDTHSHSRTLTIVLGKLQSVGLRLNPKKCIFFMEEISYLGFTIDKNGLRKNDTNIRSVLHAPIPTNVSEVKAFIGMVNFYSKFVPNFAQKMEPFYKLLRKDTKFHWNDATNSAYELLKKEITGDQVLVHFDREKPVILTTDACDTAVAGILSHEFENGELKPVAYVSRSLSPAERNYSTIQKEALAIVFSVTKLYQYLIGINFILQTDHKPLISIFGEHKGIPLMAAARMQRWAFILSGFNFKIRHVKGSLNHADTLSRIPQANYINFINSNNQLQLSFKNIQIETRRDKVLSKLIDAVQSGTVSTLTGEEFIPYKNKGIVKTKALARSFIWWPKIDRDIEDLIKSCHACRLQQPSPEKSALIPWNAADHAWSRIHIDYAGPIHGYYLLIIIDSFSKWIEVFKTKTITSACTIKFLRETFCRYGLPDIIVSDNGRQFTLNEFAEFIKNNHIKHIFTAPGHPATNGQAENSVKTVKKSLLANLEDKKPIDFDYFLNIFLFDYRISVHCTTGVSPSQVMLNRTLKSRFTLLKPPLVKESIVEAQKKNISNFRGKREVAFEIGDKVYIRDYTNPNKPSWTPAKIKEKFGPRNYGCVITQNGREIKRHLNQIREISTSQDVTPELSTAAIKQETQQTREHTNLRRSTPDTIDVHAVPSKGEEVVKPVNDALDSNEDDLNEKVIEKTRNVPSSSRPIRETASIAKASIADQYRSNLV